jgi:hypothetical protein
MVSANVPVTPRASEHVQVHVDERNTTMCLDCGCGEPNERHGDDRHIIMDDVKAAAQASEISVDEAARNIAQGLGEAQKASAAD